MSSLITVGVGVVAVVLGIAWVIWPAEMKEWQRKYLYFGVGEPDDEQTRNEEIAGRVSGAILAILGAALALGLFP